MTLDEFGTQVYYHNYKFSVSPTYHASVINRIDNFAQKMQNKGQSSDYYIENRKASFPTKDIKLGKYGEFAASLALSSGAITSERFPIVIPDCEVRVGNKGWDCDLPFAKKDSRFPNCHVKTCDQRTSDFVKEARGDEYTWTFQWGNASGRGGRDKLFDTPESDELILFMFVPYIDSRKIIMVASAPWREVIKIAKEPIADKFRNIKKCIYSNDLLLLANEYNHIYI